jgi:hypothetical protein
MVLPDPVTGHGVGWSFPDQAEDDYRQLVWGFEIDADGDFLINWSNAFSFGFQATMLGPDGITSTSFSIGTSFSMAPSSQMTLIGTQWIPGAENWLGQPVKITLVYTRPPSFRRLKLGRSSSLISRLESRQNSCTTCANCSNV